MRRYRGYILLGLVLLLVVHHDFWNWNSTGLWLGIPAGLMFHLLLCVAASSLLTLLVLAGERSGARSRRPCKSDSA